MPIIYTSLFTGGLILAFTSPIIALLILIGSHYCYSTENLESFNIRGLKKFILKGYDILILYLFFLIGWLFIGQPVGFLLLLLMSIAGPILMTISLPYKFFCANKYVTKNRKYALQSLYILLFAASISILLMSSIFMGLASSS